MTLRLVTEGLSREQRVRIGYAAWVRGDLATLASLVTEDCEFTLIGNPVLNPHSGLRIGINGLRELIRLSGETFIIRECLLETVLVSGEHTAVHWHATMELRANGRIIESERCDLLRWRGPLIHSVKSFYDSATMAVMTGRVEVTARGPARPVSRRA